MNRESNLATNQAAIRAAEGDLHPWELSQSDEEVLSETTLPTPLDNPYDPTQPAIRQVADAAEQVAVPHVYGPIEIIKHVETITNAMGKAQASVQANLLQDGRKYRLLVSGFGGLVSEVEKLEEGAQYELRGILIPKVNSLNGEKIVSLYLNLV